MNHVKHGIISQVIQSSVAFFIPNIYLRQRMSTVKTKPTRNQERVKEQKEKKAERNKGRLIPSLPRCAEMSELPGIAK